MKSYWIEWNIIQWLVALAEEGNVDRETEKPGPAMTEAEIAVMQVKPKHAKDSPPEARKESRQVLP